MFVATRAILAARGPTSREVPVTPPAKVDSFWIRSIAMLHFYIGVLAYKKMKLPVVEIA